MDRRIKRTRRLLGEALIDLLQTSDFYAISVRDITEKADVAYSTFFRNFESREQLLLVYLQDFWNTIVQTIIIDAQQPFKTQTREYMRHLFIRLRDQPKMCRVILKTPAVTPILASFKADLVAANLETFRHMGLPLHPDSPPADLVFGNGMTQVFTLIDWWLDQDFETDLDTMVDYYETMILRPKWGVLLGQDAMRTLMDTSGEHHEAEQLIR